MSHAASPLAALGDPMRRALLERLAERPQSVGELARGLPVTRPAVSQHLKVLKEASLVTDRADGTRRVYQIDPAGLAAIRQWLDQHWERAMAGFAAAAEERGHDGSAKDQAGADHQDDKREHRA
jgi:DNA-binding transcriptional ArsR family regulator